MSLAESHYNQYSGVLHTLPMVEARGYPPRHWFGLTHKGRSSSRREIQLALKYWRVSRALQVRFEERTSALLQAI